MMTLNGVDSVTTDRESACEQVETQPDFTPDDLEAAGAVRKAPDPGYQRPTDVQVLSNLEHWQDMRLGVIIHWGIYTAIGQGGSWSLHRQHLGDFTDPPAAWTGSDADYQTWYYDQSRTFTGKNFDAEQWARVCQGAGAKYLVFTTKHHDGFALYDTCYSNCKSSAEDAGLKRDVFKEVTGAFRKQGLRIGAYFSKADWHHPSYWDRGLKITDRFHNYSRHEQPKRWQTFVDFTHNQIEEILSNYGKIDVLWLDAGWVREPEEPIDMPRIAQMARNLQPGILVVDREVHGPFEDYRTPEQEIPDQILDYPWESCVTLTKTWCSLRPDEPAKPIAEILHNLLRIVSRGGNYLIGIGPDATGAMPPQVEQRLGELGGWLEKYGVGIYGSRPVQLADTPDDGSAGFVGEPPWQWYATKVADQIFAYGINLRGVQTVPPTHTTVTVPRGLDLDKYYPLDLSTGNPVRLQGRELQVPITERYTVAVQFTQLNR